MKRSERHHLKENKVVTFVTYLQRLFQEQRTAVLAGGLAIAVVIASIIGYTSWRGRTRNQAAALLVEAALVQETRVGPPTTEGAPASGPSFATERERNEQALSKLQALADQYGNTPSGLEGRYRTGAVLMALGRPGDAVTAYQRVIADAGSSMFGRTARLGLAEAQAQAGDYEQAIAGFEALADGTDGFPVDGVLMQLGRVYRTAGRVADAEKTFGRLVDEFPGSPFAGDARRELEVLGADQPGA